MTDSAEFPLETRRMLLTKFYYPVIIFYVGALESIENVNTLVTCIVRILKYSR